MVQETSATGLHFLHDVHAGRGGGVGRLMNGDEPRVVPERDSWGASESIIGADTLVTSLFCSEPPRSPPPTRRGHTLPWPQGRH